MIWTLLVAVSLAAGPQFVPGACEGLYVGPDVGKPSPTGGQKGNEGGGGATGWTGGTGKSTIGTSEDASSEVSPSGRSPTVTGINPVPTPADPCSGDNRPRPHDRRS